eukprot:3219320-Pyramimonas_sp.AAC.1
MWAASVACPACVESNLGHPGCSGERQGGPLEDCRDPAGWTAPSALTLPRFHASGDTVAECLFLAGKQSRV